jgi:hypothetical protein
MIHYPDVLRKNALHTDALQFPNVDHTKSKLGHTATPCSLGLSATSQQYFFLRINQPPATSQKYFISEQTSTSHQPPAKRTGFSE